MIKIFLIPLEAKTQFLISYPDSDIKHNVLSIDASELRRK